MPVLYGSQIVLEEESNEDQSPLTIDSVVVKYSWKEVLSAAIAFCSVIGLAFGAFWLIFGR